MKIIIYQLIDIPKFGIIARKRSTRKYKRNNKPYPLRIVAVASVLKKYKIHLTFSIENKKKYYIKIK